MTNLRIWLRRVLLLLRRDRATRELEDEMRLHRELRAAALIADGGTADGANTAARRAFGNPVQLAEQSRDAWGFAWLDDLRQDVRYAVRGLRQRPAFTASVVVVLALGIGATTAMFSAVDAAMLRPLPFPHAEQLVTLPDIEIPFDQASPPNHMVHFTDLHAMPEFSGVAAYASGGLNLSDADHPRRLRVGVVTASFFATLGVNPVLGRGFSDDEGRPGGADVVVLSNALWRGQFGSRNMLNQTVRLNGKPYTVVGIAPPNFSFPDQSDLWIPMTVPVTFATFEPFRGFLNETVIGRIASGVSVQRANLRLLTAWRQGFTAEVDSFRHQNMKETLDEVEQEGAVTPLQQELVGTHRDALLILLGTTVCLLLIACANASNLLLAQSAARRREVALRSVLGATRTRVVRQFLAESVMLSVTGAAAGLLLAPPLLRAMAAALPTHLAGMAPAHVDLRVLFFAAALSLATGIGFGLWPALRVSGTAPGETIKAGGSSGTTTTAGGRVRRGLVALEIALTLMLLIGAGLMLRSFAQLMRVDRGFDTEHVGTVEVSFNAGEDPHGTGELERMHRILARLDATPGIAASGIVNNLPLGSGGGIGLSIVVDGAPPPKPGEMAFARYLIASPGYFAALRIPIISGRRFNAGDDGSGKPVAIINQAMAKQFWPGRNPMGLTFRESTNSPPIRVVGIAGDVRESLAEAPGPQMYFPIDAQPSNNIAIVARGNLPAPALLSRLAAAVRSVDPTQAVYHLRTMDDVLSTSVAPRRTNTLLISLFAALALVLASLGVYAVVSQGVAQRAREFGIRSALGASGADLLRLVGSEMLWIAAVGIAAGLAGAWALARLISSMLYGVTVHDPITFLAVPLILLVPAALATLIPASRATHVNPADVMRAE